jgi:putative endonuclease
MSFWVYIIRCSDGSYYTGHTDNLEGRIAQHSSGAIPSCYTFSRRPLECVFSQDFPTREEALASEQQIKGWGRKKKEAMICGDWAEVSRLAHSSVRSEPLEAQLVVRQAHHERQPPVVEGQHERQPPVVEGQHERQTPVSPGADHERRTPVRPEPVEGHFDEGQYVVRQAHQERHIPIRPEPVEVGPRTKL